MTTSQAKTERGHASPFVRQFSVFLANRVGSLSELLALLGGAKVELVGLAVAEMTEAAILRTVFADPDKAREVLKRGAVPFTECDVLAVVLEEADTLQRVCESLVSAELNLHFAYPLLIRRGDRPVMAIHVDDHTLAVSHLARRGFTLLDHEGA
jgi:hypothetical protein